MLLRTKVEASNEGPQELRCSPDPKCLCLRCLVSGQSLCSLNGLSPTGEGFPGLPQPVLTTWDRGAAFRSQGEASKGELGLVWERLDFNPPALNASQACFETPVRWEENHTPYMVLCEIYVKTLSPSQEQ